MWKEIMKRKDLRLGMIVYHRDIYDYREQMKVVGITEDTLILEGDLSGGTHVVCQRTEVSISGTSVIYDYGRKLKMREDAISTETLLVPCDNSNNLVKSLRDMIGNVMTLTSDVSMNPEIK